MIKTPIATPATAAEELWFAQPQRRKLEVTAMATEMRKTGIDVVGDMAAWGTHFCLFYETKEDLLDTLISYCKAGLESEECCLWIVAEPLTIEEATAALKARCPTLIDIWRTPAWKLRRRATGFSRAARSMARE